MTEQQIKQSAEEYAKKIYPYTAGKAAAIRDFIAGAHSRDEQLEELQNELESIRRGFYERGDKLKELMLANNKLRNDNKDLEQALAAAEDVLDVQMEKLDKLRNPWISVEEELPEEHSRVLIMFCNGTVTYNDYIGVGDINYMKAHSKTITHWMPIPALNPAEQLISGLQEMNQQFKKGE